MSDLIERVVRAICARHCLCQEIGLSRCVNTDHTNGPCEATLNQLTLSTKMDEARAAIAAMREATNEMKRDGLLAMVQYIDSRQKPSIGIESDFERGMRAGLVMRNSLEVEAAWHAMIDAALKEGE